MIWYLLQGLGYGGAAAAQPGPFQAYLLSQTLKNGLGSTLVAALAPLMSDGPIVLLVLLVLTQMPDWFVAALRFAGGFFLLYLAVRAYKAGQVTVDTAVVNTPAINLYKKLGFTPLKQWQTPDNIPMITLHREQVL